MFKVNIDNIKDQINAKEKLIITLRNEITILKKKALIPDDEVTPDRSGLDRYLIMVGIRSHEYNYTDEQIFDNIEYFNKCRIKGLSAYKALLFFNDYLDDNYDINRLT